MGSWGIGHWIIVLIVVLLVFGTKRLTSGAKDMGKAVNEFKKGMRGEEEQKPAEQLQDATRDQTAADKPKSKHDAAPH
ncbi:MAG: twin-arginine translocase TatA/TatE family subunit [Xanthomonadaceae bacterium]|jgi:sec-independent protein translocase protein TatA|nr:twin-arginine translocase TatA/TatE family subunit [Xanthomonadaceae bacterium]